MASAAHAACDGDARRFAASDSGIDNAQYDALHDDWWREDGPHFGLHQMNPRRVEFFAEAIRQHGRVRRVLEIGCGGGILSEALARELNVSHGEGESDSASAGLQVVGLDISNSSVEAARRHIPAELRAHLSYVCASAYDTGIPSGSFDCVVMSDVLEHLERVGAAVQEMSRVLCPERGLFLFDTFNRTPSSFFFAILMAQDVLRFLPRHSHVYSLFITPDELALLLAKTGLAVEECRGLSSSVTPLSLLKYILTLGRSTPQLTFSWTDALSIQYFGSAVRSSDSSHT